MSPANMRKVAAVVSGVIGAVGVFVGPSAWAQKPSVQQPQPTYQQPTTQPIVLHQGPPPREGIFFNLDAGFDAISAQSGEVTLSGSGFGMNLRVGYSVTHSLIGYVSLCATSTDGGEFEYMKMTQNVNGSIVWTGLGVGARAYSSRSLFADLSIGIGGLEFKDPDGTGIETDPGFHGALAIGKEWHLASGWYLGPTVRFGGGSTKYDWPAASGSFGYSQLGFYLSVTNN